MKVAFSWAIAIALAATMSITERVLAIWSPLRAPQNKKPAEAGSHLAGRFRNASDADEVPSRSIRQSSSAYRLWLPFRSAHLPTQEEAAHCLPSCQRR